MSGFTGLYFGDPAAPDDGDPDHDGHLVRPRCGVVSAKPALYDRLLHDHSSDAPPHTDLLCLPPGP